jgi:hypothetical protein
MPKEIIGGWMHDFDLILSSNCKNKSIIWIYRWTCWMICWRPSQLRPIGRYALNRTHIHSSGVMTMWDLQFGNSSVLTSTWIRSDGLETLLTPAVSDLDWDLQYSHNQEYSRVLCSWCSHSLYRNANYNFETNLEFCPMLIAPHHPQASWSCIQFHIIHFEDQLYPIPPITVMWLTAK